MKYKVAVIGLGYVGLPLAVESGKHYPTVGFDISTDRITELGKGHDRTREVETDEFASAVHLKLTSSKEDIKGCNFYIVTVPTPIDEHKSPNLSPLIAATKTISEFLEKGDIVVYESTVFPGCTEEVCVPILEESGLKYNEDFFCGYSPERINPGDKVHTLTSILKVTSGSNEDTAEKVDDFYKSLITAGTYRASSIKVAESAKAIENAQRDINIAFVNELAMIFQRIGVDTQEVLEAAGTKWNFLKFSPGLVGGHCIGVDPYYLTHKAQSLGYDPQVILSGRQINDGMGIYIAQRTIKMLSLRKKWNEGSKILVMGVTFKENCPDIRNSRVIDIYKELESYGIEADVYDPLADGAEVHEEYGFGLVGAPEFGQYRAVIIAVAHDLFRAHDWAEIRNEVDVIFDVKGLIPKELSDARL